MQPERIWELMKKDWSEAFRSKQILLSMTVLPAFMALGVPIIFLLSISFATSGNTDPELAVLLNFLPPLTQDWEFLTERARSYVLMSVFGLLFLLLVPVMITSFVGTDAIVGEKERDTIEGLLALPLTESEILAAKIGSSLIPVLVLTWLLSGLYVVIVDIITFQDLNRLLLPDLRFILVILLFTPLLSLATTEFIVMISSRVSSTRDAQQLTGLFVLPVMLLVVSQLFVLLIDVWLILLGIVILGGFDLLAFKFAIKIFNRENLMSAT
ncbi:MAG: ABC transporter permease subunit [Candidatus Thorarchaeota archaeon]